MKRARSPKILRGAAVLGGAMLLGTTSYGGDRLVQDPMMPPAPPPVAMGPKVVRGSLWQQGMATAAAAAVTSDPEHVASPLLSQSFTAVADPKSRKFQKNDLIQIVVSEISDSQTSAKSDAEKKQAFDLAIQQWTKLGLSANGVPKAAVVGNSSTLPEVKFNYDNNKQNTADSGRTDSLTARIQAKVLDVKPNGTLLLEATKVIGQDDNEQIFRLSGLIRAQDVAADNSVLSTQVADLRLSKQTTGTVSDNTKTGWLNKVIDKVSPF